MKICTKCKKEKSIKEFYKHSGQKSGLHPNCKECVKIFYNEKYASSAQVKARKAELQHARWHSDTSWRELHSIRNRQYFLKHKEQMVERGRQYNANRREVDLEFKIRGNLRARLNTALKTNVKAGSSVTDLGCSIDEFKTYLESKFQSGMTWENWSKTGWHIDHIKPLASFDLTNPEQFRQAAHFTNLQPLWAKDNLRKGSSQ